MLSYESHEDYDLIARMKSINATLRKAQSSVIERYAGVAELALFKDVQKVGLLTDGLFDQNVQVRTLAANALRSYGLGETARIVLDILSNDEQILKDVIHYHEQERFVELFTVLEKILRKPRTPVIDGEIIDYDRRHVLAILLRLGEHVRELQAVEATNWSRGKHLLKQILEEKNNRWILPAILKALDESRDIYCRRGAIEVIGELELDFGFDKQAYDLICEAIDQEDNRNDHLVTWDGIQALTKIVQQSSDSEKQGKFYQLLREIFNSRTYDIDDYETRVEHCFITRLHCIEAFMVLRNYEQLKLLMDDGEREGFLRMMDVPRPDKETYETTKRVKGSIARVKKAIIDTLLLIYRDEYQIHPDQVTETQRDILQRVSGWISSQDRRVSVLSIRFFSDLPNPQEALSHLMGTAEDNNRTVQDVVARFQAQRKEFSQARLKKYMQTLENVLEDRKELLLTFGGMFSTVFVDRQNVAPMQLIELLRNWCLQRVLDEQQRELKTSTIVRLEALWILNNLAMRPGGAEYTIFSKEEIVSLLREEQYISLRCVLELFHARMYGDSFIERLEQVAYNLKEARSVSVCAELELIIQKRGIGIDLSRESLAYIPGRIGYVTEIHMELAQRFFAVLGNMQQPNADALITALLKDHRLPEPLQLQLRQHLSPYQCYQNRHEIVADLLKNTKKRYADSVKIHWNYINLLRAGEKPKTVQEENEGFLEYQDLSPIQQNILNALLEISRTYDECELPILFNEGEECIVALDGTSPEQVNSLLYAYEERQEKSSVLKGYLSTQKFHNSWLFLDKPWTDAEIALQMYKGARKITPSLIGREIGSDFSKRIVGKILTVVEDGVYVDIGLSSYTPFVGRESLAYPKMEISQQQEETANWLRYAEALVGKLLTLNILSAVFESNDDNYAIACIDLLRVSTRDDMFAEMFRGALDKTIYVQVYGVDAEGQRVLFQKEGRILYVSSSELSWNPERVWRKEDGWLRYFESKIGQNVELTYNGKKWTLKENKPHSEYFAQLLYKHGKREFDLIFVANTELGYVFEIESGSFCYVPADRLVDERLHTRQNHTQTNFLLPNRTIGSGDILKVHFDLVKIDKREEVVLLVSEIKAKAENKYLRGMKISGTLSDINEKERIGKLTAFDADLAHFDITIHKLPLDDPSIDIRENATVDGRIEYINSESEKLDLDHALTMPADLREGQIYPCRVAFDPRPNDYALQLHYDNVRGELREGDMTYGHEPVIQRYHRGNQVMARLLRVRWDQRLNRTVKPKLYEQMIADLGLEQGSMMVGDVIKRRGNLITIEREDRFVFNCSVSQLDLDDDERYIQPGVRVHFTRDQSETLNLTVSSTYAHFSLLPSLTNSDDWHCLDKLSNKQLDEFFPLNQQRDCIYVTRLGLYYLLELKPGELIALPLHMCEDHPSEPALESPFWCLKQEQEYLCAESFRNDEDRDDAIIVATGDTISFIRRQPEAKLQVHNFKLGPLHVAAEPYLAGGADDASEQPLPLTAQVIRVPTARENGVPVEIVSIRNTKYKLRNGLRSFYSTYKMNHRDRKYFDNRIVSAQQEFTLTLDSPPTMRDGRLWLAVRGIADLPPTARAHERLPKRNVKREPEKQDPYPFIAELQAGIVVNGVISEYSKHESAFRIFLDDLIDTNQSRYRCWLGADMISYSLINSYPSLSAFANNLPKKFAIHSIDMETLTLEVSLKDNPPIDIDEAGKVFEWSNGQVFKHATFVQQEALAVPRNTGNDTPHLFDEEGMDSKEVVQEDHHTSTEQSVPATVTRQIVTIELTPGVLLSVPAERLFIDDVPYNTRGERSFFHQGDQMTLRVRGNEERFDFHVVSWQTAEINMLNNRRRVFYGRVGTAVPEEENTYQLRLEGYNQAQCLLKIDPAHQISPSSITGYDLFRIDHCDFALNIAYFQPVRVSDLKPDDILRVRYQPLAKDWTNRVTVMFGKQHVGYIQQHEISYRTDFKLSEFSPAPDHEEFDARVVEVRPHTHVAFFSLKNVSTHSLRYFLDAQMQTKLQDQFQVTLVRKSAQKQSIDIEIEPGSFVRVPSQHILFASDLHFSWKEMIDLCMPGDTLQFELVIDQQHSTVYLKLVGLTRSLLHYLKPGMLVNAHFDQLSNGIVSGDWQFSLPDYEGRLGRLIQREHKDFFPGIFSRDLQLVIDRILPDPSSPLHLRQRLRNDSQQVLRVSYVGSDRIEVQQEDGLSRSLVSRNVTYRVENRISYVQKFLHPGDLIVATREVNQKGTPFYTLLNNPSTPFVYLAQYVQKKQKRTFEITYVRSTGEDRIFEIEPGLLITVPRIALSFYGYPLQEMQRFLPGDVFEVNIEEEGPVERKQMHVKIQKLHLSILHSWTNGQYIEAIVQDVYPNSQGILIKAGPLEEFLHEQKMLKGHVATSFTVGSKIWVLVEAIRGREIILHEVAMPDIKALVEVSADKKKPDPIMFATFDPGKPLLRGNTVMLKVLDNELVEVRAHELAWCHVKRAEEVIVKEEAGFWVYLSKNKNGNGAFFARPKYSMSVNAAMSLLKRNTIVQARVDKVSQDQQERAIRTLLNVDGLRTLVHNEDLVWGVPSDVRCVEVGTWLAVRVQSINVSAGPHLQVSATATGNAIKNRVFNEPFSAVVRYTLPHGLVFSYQGELGYIANQNVSWNRGALAQELFKSGDLLTVYKMRTSHTPFIFSLTHNSQFEGLKNNDALDATIVVQNEEHIYLRTLDLTNNFYLLVSKQRQGFMYLSDLPLGERIQLQLTDIEALRSVTGMREGFQIRSERSLDVDVSSVDAEILFQNIDRFYTTSIAKFMLHLQRDGGLVAYLKQTPVVLGVLADRQEMIQRFIQYLNECNIPCTYRNIRVLLGELYKLLTFPVLWSIFAEYHRPAKVQDIVFVLCETAHMVLAKDDMQQSKLQKDMHYRYTYYALGISSLIQDVSQEDILSQALEYLFLAYSYEQAADIEVALLTLYEKLRIFSLRRYFLQKVVSRFAQNSIMLLNLPEPTELDDTAYKELKHHVPGFGETTLDAFAKSVRSINESIIEGHLDTAQKRLRSLIAKINWDKIVVPELHFNLALCLALQSNFEQALLELETVKQQLDRTSKSNFPFLRLAYYRLGIYLHVHLRKFPQLLAFFARGVQQDFELWQQSWRICYLLLAAGHRPMSKEISLLERPSRYDPPEQMLLSAYWEDLEQKVVAPLSSLQRVHESLFSRLYKETGNWEQKNLQFQFLPHMQRRGELRDVIKMAYDYDTPTYALKRYHNETRSMSVLTDENVVMALIDLALRDAEFGLAQSVIHAYLGRKISQYSSPPVEDTRLLKSFYTNMLSSEKLEQAKRSYPQLPWSAILEKPEKSSHAQPHQPRRVGDQLGLAGQSLLQRWVKSSQSRFKASQNVASFMHFSPQLRTEYWQQASLRTTLWQVFAQSGDYGALLTMLPPDVPLEALEDIVFHLYSVGLYHKARLMIQKVQMNNKTTERSYGEYLDVLLELSTSLQEHDLSMSYAKKQRVFEYLFSRVSQRMLIFYEQKEERALAIKALEILVQYPELSVQSTRLLLLGELLLLQGSYGEAQALYMRMISQPGYLGTVSDLRAALSLLCLLMLDTDKSVSLNIILDRVREASVDSPYTRFLVDFFELFAAIDIDKYRSALAAMVGRIQLLLETVGEKDILAIGSISTLQMRLDALFYALRAVPQGGLCLSSLYTLLVYLCPLTEWPRECIEQFLYSFVDFSLSTGFQSEIDDHISSTLKSLHTYLPRKTNPLISAEVDASLQIPQLEENIQFIQEWIYTYRLIKMPEKIEEKASAVKKFFVTGDRLSRSAFNKATMRLINTFGTSCPHYGSSTRWLIIQMLTDEDDPKAAMNQIYNEPDEAERDSFLLQIIFYYFRQHDFRAIADVSKQISVQQNGYVEQFVKRWQSIESQLVHGKSVVTSTGHKQKDTLVALANQNIEYIRQYGQVDLAYKQFTLLLRQCNDVAELEELWYQFLECASSRHSNTTYFIERLKVLARSNMCSYKHGDLRVRMFGELNWLLMKEMFEKI